MIRKSEVNDAEEGSDEDKAALLQKALHKTLHKVLVYSEGYRLLRKEITLADLEELADDEKKKLILRIPDDVTTNSGQVMVEQV